jgi:two-component system phosphate regulon sensor histidine kinase PhoR
MQAETESIRTNQAQVRDSFLSHVSHELRSPLTSIYSFSTIVADGLAGETSSQQDEYLQIILRNVRQLRGMIEDLLEATQVRAGKLRVEWQPVSVDEAIVYAMETLQGVAREREVSLSFRRSTNLPLVCGDATRVRQILTILIDNAIKFTPAGGLVNVRASIDRKVEGYLLIEVSDTGCGIPAGATERIFEHLQQVTDPAADPGRAGRRGLGLGLHIAKELVTLLGGKIWVNSEPQKGSQFFFTLCILPSTGLVQPILTQERRPGEEPPGTNSNLIVEPAAVPLRVPINCANFQEGV